MKGVPPPLYAKKGLELFEAAKAYGITHLSAKRLDGKDWSAMALDISGATKVSVREYLSMIQAASVTLQPSDLPLYFSDHILEAVRANWNQFQPSLTDLEPDEITEACDKIGAVVWKHNPVVKPFIDPESEHDETGQYIGTRELRDETFVEMQRLEREQKLAEDAAYAQSISDPFGLSY